MTSWLLKVGVIVADAALLAELRAALAANSVQVLFERTADTSVEELRATVLRLQPDALLLSAGCCELAAGVSALAGSPALVAIHPSADPERILAAMRSGVKEFVYPPFQSHLPDSLERVRQERTHSAARSGRLIAFASAKGGCGSTTVACHAAAELASARQERVLLADVDPDGGGVGFLMNSKSPYSLNDAVENVGRLDPSYWQALISNGYPNLEVIQGAPPTLFPSVRPESHLREVLRFMRVQYPWTVLDMGRGRTPAVWSGIEPPDDIFLVCTVDIMALHQARQAVRALGEVGVDGGRIRLVLNAVPKNPLVTPQEIEATLGVGIFAVLPSDEEAMVEAQSSRRLVSSSSAYGRQVARMVAKLTGQADPAPKRRFPFFSSAR
jgi:pilus assembly protein CpaE